jgi:hypothetical protein
MSLTVQNLMNISKNMFVINLIGNALFAIKKKMISELYENNVYIFIMSIITKMIFAMDINGRLFRYVRLAILKQTENVGIGLVNT